ncbi:MAG: DUF4157 domain-containing protein [Moorea sp. SIO4G3]|nr:DUF4157 domain-containing protein [Moorena sp. SIO4G3]
MQGKVPPWVVGEDKVENPPTMGRHGQVQQHRTKGMPYAPREGGRDVRETPVQRMEEYKKPENKTGLPDRLKEGIESMSGYDLSGVRVNYNSPKPAQLNAHAYTQGLGIEVAPGQERHLRHEAWHVVQQMQGRVRATKMRRGVKVNDEEGLEREAEVMGEKIRKENSAHRRKKGAEENNPSNVLRDTKYESSERKKESQEIAIGERGKENGVVQRVIIIEEETEAKTEITDSYLENIDDDEKKFIEDALRNNDLGKTPERTLEKAKEDSRIYWITKEKDENDKIINYEVINVVENESREQGTDTIVGDSTPRRVMKPEKGKVLLEVKGLLECIGVIIEGIGNNDEVIGAAGGHFVTKNMFDNTSNRLTENGEQFMTQMREEVKQIGGKENQFNIYIGTGTERDATIAARLVIKQYLEQKGYKFENLNEGYYQVRYQLSAERGYPEVSGVNVEE